VSADVDSFVLCPHCGEPLEVKWEVWRVWPVVRVGMRVLLGGGMPKFEGGECTECDRWVDEKDVC